MIEASLKPDFGGQGQWRLNWLKWEQKLHHYAAATEAQLGDDAKISLVRGQAPPELQSFMRVSDPGSYATFKQVLEEYWAV